jgi:tRNA threonylcarbamoyladenosine biosynthesis protein TsaE
MTSEAARPTRIETALPDETATLALGARLAGVLAPGLRVYVSGDLGAGKTTLARGILRALGFQGRVKSPTFTLAELYKLSNLCLYHFDFYRFKASDEWEDAGFREIFGSEAVCLVEWPERASALLPAADLRIRLEHAGQGREATIEGLTRAGRRCVETLRD